MRRKGYRSSGRKGIAKRKLLKEKAVSTKIYLSLGSWALKFSLAMGNAFGVTDGTADSQYSSAGADLSHAKIPTLW
jgi:hypothetical protein